MSSQLIRLPAEILVQRRSENRVIARNLSEERHR